MLPFLLQCTQEADFAACKLQHSLGESEHAASSGYVRQSVLQSTDQLSMV